MLNFCLKFTLKLLIIVSATDDSHLAFQNHLTASTSHLEAIFLSINSYFKCLQVIYKKYPQGIKKCLFAFLKGHILHIN